MRLINRAHHYRTVTLRYTNYSNEKKESKVAERGKGIVKVENLFFLVSNFRLSWNNTTLEQSRNHLLKILDLPLNLCKNTKNSNKNGWVLYIIGGNVGYCIWSFYHHRENSLYIWKIIIDWELITEYLSYSIYYTMSHIVSYCTYCIIQTWIALVKSTTIA